MIKEAALEHCNANDHSSTATKYDYAHLLLHYMDMEVHSSAGGPVRSQFSKEVDPAAQHRVVLQGVSEHLVVLWHVLEQDGRVAVWV